MSPTARRSEPTTRRPRASSASQQLEWLLLVYKVPVEPSKIRVGIWRELKRLGALYLQQAVALVPNRPDVAEAVTAVRQRITDLGGTSHFFEIPPLPADQEETLVRGFRDLATKEYAEIVEECETKFIKEIEFERFRGNYTFEEAEEIRQDLDKIRRWLDKVIARDWFEAPGRDEVADWLKRCEQELDAFEDDVFEKTGGQDTQDQ